MSKRKKKSARHSGLSAHRKIGTTLVPKLAYPNLGLIEWERDWIPEHLWLAALSGTYPLEYAQRPFNELLDALEKVWPHPAVPPIGFLSDFGQIPVEVRGAFVHEHAQLIGRTFLEPIGRILAFYPESPCHWMIPPSFLAEEGTLDPEVELANLRRLIGLLLPGKDEVAARLRILPFARLFNNGKFSIPDRDILELMSRYPMQCNEEERRRLESISRAGINTHLQTVEYYQTKAWPKYFWRRNHDLLPCRPMHIPIKGSQPVKESEASAFVEALQENGNIARAYLALLSSKVPCDLYSPERDETLFGLISRAMRLFILLMEDPLLWARDTSGIFLRCLAETVITYAYLAKCGDEKDFKRFIDHGEGQAKLLMLHLQDTYPSDTSLEGRDFESISEEPGHFWSEFINIELGSWSKKDTRKLASEAGLEKLYRIVFTPASADVHGTWMSLKQSNFSFCLETLHRFHRLPGYVEPPLYVHTMLYAQALIEQCIQVGVQELGYPAPEVSFVPIRGAISTALTSEVQSD